MWKMYLSEGRELEQKRSKSFPAKKRLDHRQCE